MLFLAFLIDLSLVLLILLFFVDVDGDFGVICTTLATPSAAPDIPEALHHSLQFDDVTNKRFLPNAHLFVPSFFPFFC